MTLVATLRVVRVVVYGITGTRLVIRQGTTFTADKGACNGMIRTLDTDEGHTEPIT
jgi:hypothetical protein